MMMNEYDVDNAVITLKSYTPHDSNAVAAAEALYWLKEWTNDNSDGWPYWVKPRRASDSLAELVKDAVREAPYGLDNDIPADALTVALRPIKAFLTRQGVEKSNRPEVLR